MQFEMFSVSFSLKASSSEGPSGLGAGVGVRGGRDCSKSSVFSEFSFSDRKLCVQHKFSVSQSPEEIRPLAESPAQGVVVGGCSSGEIATSFPISQKLRGGNQASEAV